MKKRLASLISVATLTPALLVAPSAAAAAEADTGPSLAGILESGAPGVIGAVTVNDQTTYEAAGYASLEEQRKATGNEAYRIGSVTKPMVAVAVMQQVEEGKVDIDQSVASYLPGVVPNGDAITVRNLLQHTSGIPEFTGKLFITPEGTLDLESYIRAQVKPMDLVDAALLPGEPSQVAPGAFSYSNTNYVLLGLILEKVTNQPASELLRHDVFLAAGMHDTILRNEDPVISQPALNGYLIDPTGVEAPYDNTTYTPSVFWTAGGVTSTPQDVNRFFDALMDGELVSMESLAAMQADAIPMAEGANISYGLGLMKYDVMCGADNPVTMWGHEGSVFGYVNQALATADGSTQVNYATNVYAALTPEPYIEMVNYSMIKVCNTL